jgi:hypothetical protein
MPRGRRDINEARSGRPLLFFAARFVLVEAFGHLGRTAESVVLATRVPTSVLICWPSALTGKSSGFSGFLEFDIASPLRRTAP